MSKIVKNTILTLLNPISPIVTLMIGWLLSIIISQPSEQFPPFINYMISNSYVVIFFIIFWLIFTVIYTELQNRNENLINEIKIRETEIKDKERQIKDSAGIILNKSGDFANFNRLLKFNEVLKGFTDNNTIVECAQMYSYSTKRVKDKIMIKVVYDCGYCSGGIDINNLAQCYYEIDYHDYITLKNNVIMTWKKLSKDEYSSITEMDAMIEILISNLTEIYKKYYNDLKSITDVSQVTGLNFTQYRIMTLLSRLARRKSITVFDKNSILGSSSIEIEKYLLNGKRTGILNSILLEDLFMFKYTRDSHLKGGRAYISFPITISMQNYICVFSIQTSDLDPKINLEKEIKALKNNLIKRFEKK